jgi:hypothetical protein
MQTSELSAGEKERYVAGKLAAYLSSLVVEPAVADDGNNSLQGSRLSHQV